MCHGPTHNSPDDGKNTNLLLSLLQHRVALCTLCLARARVFLLFALIVDIPSAHIVLCTLNVAQSISLQCAYGDTLQSGRGAEPRQSVFVCLPSQHKSGQNLNATLIKNCGAPELYNSIYITHRITSYIVYRKSTERSQYLCLGRKTTRRGASTPSLIDTCAPKHFRIVSAVAHKLNITARGNITAAACFA